jgi:hypothetical protein
VLGNFLYVVGGEGPNGPTNGVYRLTLENGSPASSESDPNTLLGWAMPVAGSGGNLPEPRTHAASFINNGVMYVIGGSDASGKPTNSTYWAVPDATSSDISSWSRTDATDLLTPRVGAAVAAIGPTAFVIGGSDNDGPTTSEERAGLSPKPPFFRLGLFGATLPALSIKGEIGQQLGYINAMTVGIINFVILVAIGIMFSHRRQTMELVSRLSRGRIRPPAEDELQI